MRLLSEGASRRWMGALLTLLALLVGQLLLGGCSSLCTKRLYLPRETPEKLQPSSQALLIADPGLAAALFPSQGPFPRGGCRWAPLQPSYESLYYRLSLDKLDDKALYQGMCLDIIPNYACEVRPGARQVLLKLYTYSPEGLESFKEAAPLNLEPGGIYFLQPECEAMAARHFRVKVEKLPEPYTAQVRSRLLDWERVNTKSNYTMEQ